MATVQWGRKEAIIWSPRGYEYTLGRSLRVHLSWATPDSFKSNIIRQMLSEWSSAGTEPLS